MARVAVAGDLEAIRCPYCGSEACAPWGHEIGFVAARCEGCRLIYVNPRPSLTLVDAAVRSGFHSEAEGLNVVSRHSPRRAVHYRKILSGLFSDLWRAGRPIAWLDVGAGYGEIVEAVGALAPPGSTVRGLEPMAPKARHARARGLDIVEDYIGPQYGPVDVVSLVDVFSHIPQFDRFLTDIVAVLRPGGELFMETGNLADLQARGDFPGELGLPDHLVFAGEEHVRGYLERAGFTVVAMRRVRVDGIVNLAKNIAKKLLGRPVKLALPYTSRYRQLLIRAKLRPR